MVKAIECLEYLQKDIYSKLGYAPNQSLAEYQAMNDELMKNILSSYEEFIPKDVIDEAKKFQKKDFDNILTMKLPTKYESRLEYSMILKVAEDVEKSVHELKLTHVDTGQVSTLKELDKNITTPFFGTLPSGNTNARTIPCDDGYLIIFESEIFYFCHLLSKIIAWSFPIEKEGGNVSFISEKNAILDRLESNREILKRFGELIIAYVIGGQNRMAPHYLIGAPYSDLASVLTQGMERFIMGHEYSHILLRHKPMKNGQLSLTDIKDVYNKMFSWPQEYEADYLGLQLMFKAMEMHGNSNWVINYSSVEAFFCGFEVMKRSIAILKRGNDDWFSQEGRKDGPVGTHPPFQNRRCSTRKLMIKKYGEDFVKMSVLVELIINNLWANTKPFMESMHKQGFPLHPKWTL